MKFTKNLFVSVVWKWKINIKSIVITFPNISKSRFAQQFITKERVMANELLGKII
jgi:hypothetical protein